MKNKIFIIYHNTEYLNNVITKLCEKYNDLIIANKFTTNQMLAENKFPYSTTYINKFEINKALKNNSLLYIITDYEYVSSGITIDEFYNADIFCLSYKEFNTISDSIFAKYNILPVWLDSKTGIIMTKSLYNEIDLLERRLENIDHEYFIDQCDDEVFDSIINFLH